MKINVGICNKTIQFMEKVKFIPLNKISVNSECDGRDVIIMATSTNVGKLFPCYRIKTNLILHFCAQQHFIIYFSIFWAITNHVNLTYFETCIPFCLKFKSSSSPMIIIYWFTFVSSFH